jgi:DNA-binding transcriptional LysR family regulator
VLSSLGLRCEVGLRVSHFAALPHLLERTRYLAMVPSASAEWWLRAANVRIFTLPVDVPEVEVSLYTYDRKPSSSAIDWLRSVICAVRQQF